MQKSERERKTLRLKLENAYNNGFKEYDYSDAYKNAGFVELKNKKIVVASELKEQISTLIDGLVKGEVTHIVFNVGYKDKIDLAIKFKGKTEFYDLRLGSESTKN